MRFLFERRSFRGGRQSLSENLNLCYNKRSVSRKPGAFALNESPKAEPARRPRVTAQDREIRRLRIFALRQVGRSYDEIARQENLTSERIRQIVVDTLERRLLDPVRDHARLQIARLDPALRLAAEKVATGDLRGVDRLIKLLDRLDKYQGFAASAVDHGENEKERLFTKILNAISNRNAAREDEETQQKAAAKEDRPPGAAEAAERMARENDVAKFFPR
jgi:hypothetical protein